MAWVITDAWRAENFSNKLKSLVSCPPAGARQMGPKISCLQNWRSIQLSKIWSAFLHACRIWSWVTQLDHAVVVHQLSLEISLYDRCPICFIYGAFVFLMVYAFTELMDGRYAVLWEVLKAASGIAIIFTRAIGLAFQCMRLQLNMLVFYFLLSVGMANW